jgi:NAD(P)-dependent dehydrogenase (short-subunit alcohol dehydrogenase family)
MRDALEGRIAIVTGASRGIDAAIAQRLAAEGAKVALVARSLEPGSGGHLAGSMREVADSIAADGGVAYPMVADFSDPDCDRAALVAEVERELGPVDVLVNITSGIVATTQLSTPQQARSSTYAPSKAALDRLTVSFATELGPEGIAVNALAPERAVATEGATAMMDLPPEWCEPIEAMAEATVALSTCDPGLDNGLVVKSVPFLDARGRATMTLDGRAVHA